MSTTAPAAIASLEVWSSGGTIERAMPRAPSHRLRPRRLLLVGMMGSGKSTLGRELEVRLGWPYLDNDRLLETATGASARELLASGGTEAVRAGEAVALRIAIATRPPAIVGVAAGTILDADLRAELDSAGDVVWLRGRTETLVRRVLAKDQDEEGDHRPWHGGGPETAAAWFREQDVLRAPLYASIADLVVDIETPAGADRTVEELADQVVVWLARPAVERRALTNGHRLRGTSSARG